MAFNNIIDRISESLDVKKYSFGIFLDLSIAFDNIDHRILLQKLQVYGISGCVLKWFCSYVTDRSHVSVLMIYALLFLQIKCGVPQGSILGPLLFITYINDIVNSSHLFQFIMFAYDTNLFASHCNLDELLKTVNQEIEKISNWLKINKLSLNIEKKTITLFFIIDKGKSPLGYYLS